MKPKYLINGMLVFATIVVTSCSAPRIAQQSNNADDVYGSTAQAKEYTPLAPVQRQAYQDTYDENDEYYGTSDPYYDMDYSSRINRFSNAYPWRSYYDPYFDNGFYGGYNGWGGYNGFSLGLGFGSVWNSPYYGWGSFYSPFYNLYNPWGWGWGYNNFYGGGLWGGGFYGGGYYGGGYYGGGVYTGRTTNVPRPSIGRENTPRNNFGMGGNTGVRGSRGSSARTDADGNVISRRTRAEMYPGNSGRPANGQSGRPTRPSGEGQRQVPQQRPTRESYRPEPQSRPSYSPPTRSESGSGRSSSGSGSSGRSSRGGRG